MASSPITSWQIDGKQWKQWRGYFGGVQRLHFHLHALEKEMAAHSSTLAWRIPGTTEPGGLPSMGSHRVGHDWCDLAAVAAAKSLQMVTAAMKLRRLLLGRKVMTNLDSIFKSRDITLPTKVRLVKAMVFPVVMYGCESWTLKKAEHRRIDAFELRCWRRLFRVPWTARRANQSTLKEISPEYSLERLMLKLQYFGYLMRRADSFEKILMLGKIEGRRRRGRQRVRW